MTTPQEPRSGQVRLAGIPWLARMIDKARLQAAGAIEQFDLEYPCPVDRGLLEQLGVSGADFQQIVVQAKTDDDVIDELKRRNAILM